MNNNTVLAIAFLIAGALLTMTTAVSTLVPAAYADNKQKAEDESGAATANCDVNGVEQAGFDCFGIALNDIEIEEESNGPPVCP